MGFPAGTAAYMLRDSTILNVFATSLVGYKAWCVIFPAPPRNSRPDLFGGGCPLRQSRKCLRGYFVGRSVASQLLKLFALLIELGVIYSASWLSRPLRLSSPPAP